MKPTETQVGGSHYKDMPIQPATFILRNGIGFHEGSAIKYLCRWRKKGGVEDLKKARHFIDMLIEDAEEAGEADPDPSAIKITGHVYCERCGKTHWMYGPCFTPEPASPAKKKAIWHNPDGLPSAGEGYRFLIAGVETRRDATDYHANKGWTAIIQDGSRALYPNVAYRTNKPLPEGWEA